MITIRWWRTTAAERDGVIHANHPLCDRPTPAGPPCNTAPAWVAAWTVNESGLPGLGEHRHVYLCGPHLHDQLSEIPFRYAGSVTVTPYEEIT